MRPCEHRCSPYDLDRAEMEAVCRVCGRTWYWIGKTKSGAWHRLSKPADFDRVVGIRSMVSCTLRPGTQLEQRLCKHRCPGPPGSTFG